VNHNAHVVPKDQIDWFDASLMRTYVVGSLQTIDNVANGMTLRPDMHCWFDQHLFVICPAGIHFRMYMIRRGADFAELLHWRSVEIPDRVSVEFLYARFALAIISLIPDTSAKQFKCFAILDAVVKVKVNSHSGMRIC
jgi:hypothetical protein